SAVYEFKPAETSFAQPASVSFPVPAGNPGAVVYWSSAAAAAQYDRMPAVVEGNRASAQVGHLGVGYLGGAPRATRTVSGALSTVFWQDDGTKTSRSGILAPPMQVKAIFVPNAHGYDRLPIDPGADSSFSVSGVPAGSYLLQIDTVYPPTETQGEAVFTELVELTTSTPDLSMVMAARPTVRSSSSSQPVTLNVMNLTPWIAQSGDYAGDMILIAGSQAHVYSRPQLSSPRPATGATSYTIPFNWKVGSTADYIGLPDAANGDVEFVYQRSTRAIGGGASLGAVHSASRFQRIGDFTLQDGVPSVLNVTLADVPQTGQLRADLHNGQFASLGYQVNPQARPSIVVGGGGVSILSIPHTVDFPDAPSAHASSSVLWIQGPLTTDVDYGVVTYGQLPAPLWQEERYATYTFEMDLPTPSGSSTSWQGGFLEFVRAGSPDPIGPVLLPPRAPAINGRDAFAPQSGVGLQPTLSWSPPSLGTATSYVVRIDLISPGIPPPGFNEVALIVYTGTSVRVPSGFLQSGQQYAATITAFSAPWDTLDRPPLRSGAPLRMADCVTAVFTP
ncbi:MAG: hypothetical protein ACXWLR_15265, partial [Myxococcales bacterium]